MDNAHAETDAVSLNPDPENKISKYVEKIKCRGPLLLSNSFGNVRSRYLREPIGSCHSLCKYGRKHESEHDEKRFSFRSFIANKMEYSGTGKVIEQNIQQEKVGTSDNSVGTNMLTLLSKHRRSVSSPHFILLEDSGRCAGSLAKEIGRSDNSINIVSEANPPTHGSIQSFEKAIFHRNLDHKIQAQVEDDEKDQIQFKKIVKSENNINGDTGKSIGIYSQVILPELPDNEMDNAKYLNNRKNKKKVNRPMDSSMPKSTSVRSNILKQNNSSALTEAHSGDNSNISKEKVLSSPKESNRSTKLKVIKQNNIVMGKQFASSKLESSNQNASLSSRKTVSSVTPAISLNVSTIPMRSISQLNTSRSMNGRMNRDEKSLNSDEMPEVGETKLLKPQRTSISTMPACSTLSLKARKSPHEILKKSGKTKDSGDVKEKTLKIIEPKIDGKGLERRENLSMGLNRHASAVCEAGEHSLNGQIQRKYKLCTASREDDKRRARRIPAVQQSADGSSSSCKLKFKKGTVIELRTADSVVLKRGRFRRGRVLGENPSGEVTKRSFRRKKDIGASNEHNSEAHAVMVKKANFKSKVGSLKYQDGQGKKDVGALFNQMIEETASMLVKTRKSKVKALVGAFETVISLLEA